ncbi:hypothetical protein RJ640_013551 [Escallonia rubra]|uniref:Methionyl-tRNA synthetase n=2 Tax=Escallonia rubra TaxID=112253 RepID=A0AA88QYK8_9ASTE|nr:hypothetical protein RJ640_013551 [Escallonia rubra]
MCFVFVCDQDERILGRQPAPGACPYCGGAVQAMDVEKRWTFCFLPLYFNTKRKHYCSRCSRRLIQILPPPSRCILLATSGVDGGELDDDGDKI